MRNIKVRVHKSSANLKKEDQLAWKIAEIASDNASLNERNAATWDALNFILSSLFIYYQSKALQSLMLLHFLLQMHQYFYPELELRVNFLIPVQFELFQI